MNFVINPYDRCIANKMVDGAQCTIVWYVDDIKVLHVNRKVVEDVMKELEGHFGTLDVTYGPKQEYLGMNLEIKDKKIIIDMTEHVDDLVDFFDEEITNTVSSPGNKNLMNIEEKSPLLDRKRHENFHSSTAKLLYIDTQKTILKTC